MIAVWHNERIPNGATNSSDFSYTTYRSTTSDTDYTVTGWCENNELHWTDISEKVKALLNDPFPLFPFQGWPKPANEIKLEDVNPLWRKPMRHFYKLHEEKRKGLKH